MPQAGKAESKRRAPRQQKFDLDFRPASYRWPRKSRSAKADVAAVEVVVVRIRIASTHGDAIVLRAKRTDDGRIRYRMLHEDAHAGNRPIRISPVSSKRPLTFGEVVAMLETAHYRGACVDPGDQARFGGVLWGTLQLHFDHGIEHADDYLFFTSIASEHYPQLEAYYRERLNDWCLANCIEQEDCKKIVRMRLRRG